MVVGHTSIFNKIITKVCEQLISHQCTYSCQYNLISWRLSITDLLHRSYYNKITILRLHHLIQWLSLFVYFTYLVFIYRWTSPECNTTTSVSNTNSCSNYCKLLFIEDFVLIALLYSWNCFVSKSEGQMNTKDASSNPDHDEVYLIQQYVVKFVSDLCRKDQKF
jgi:hypothetical protein